MLSTFIFHVDVPSPSFYEEEVKMGPALTFHNKKLVIRAPFPQRGARNTKKFFLLFVGAGPFGPPPSLASLESPGKWIISNKQKGLLCGVGIRALASGPRPETVAPGWRLASVCESRSSISPPGAQQPTEEEKTQQPRVQCPVLAGWVGGENEPKQAQAEGGRGCRRARHCRARSRERWRYRAMPVVNP